MTTTEWKQDNPGCNCECDAECFKPECQCFDGCVGAFTFKFTNITDNVIGVAVCSTVCRGIFYNESTSQWNLWDFDCVNETRVSAQPHGVTGESGLWVGLYNQGPAIGYCEDEQIHGTVVWAKLVVVGTTMTIAAQIDKTNSDYGTQWVRFVWTFDISEGCPDFSGSTVYYPDSTTYGGTVPPHGCDLSAAEATIQ